MLNSTSTAHLPITEFSRVRKQENYFYLKNLILFWFPLTKEHSKLAVRFSETETSKYKCILFSHKSSVLLVISDIKLKRSKLNLSILIFRTCRMPLSFGLLNTWPLTINKLGENTREKAKGWPVNRNKL